MGHLYLYKCLGVNDNRHTMGVNKRGGNIIFIGKAWIIPTARMVPPDEGPRHLAKPRVPHAGIVHIKPADQWDTLSIQELAKLPSSPVSSSSSTGRASDQCYGGHT